MSSTRVGNRDLARPGRQQEGIPRPPSPVPLPLGEGWVRASECAVQVACCSGVVAAERAAAAARVRPRRQVAHLLVLHRCEYARACVLCCTVPCIAQRSLLFVLSTRCIEASPRRTEKCDWRRLFKNFMRNISNILKKMHNCTCLVLRFYEDPSVCCHLII